MLPKIHEKRKWLTLGDSAKYLSLLTGAELNTADLAQLAVEANLTLSIDLTKNYSCILGKKVPLQSANVWRFSFDQETQLPQGSLLLPEGERRIFLPWRPSNLRGSGGKGGLLMAATLSEVGTLSKADCAIAYEGDFLPDNSGVLEFNYEEIETITGCWDLSMMGSERLDVEALYRSIDVSSIDEMNFRGVILRHPIANRWATLCQRCSSEHEDLFHSGFSPLISLPEMEQIVIRPNALQRFADSIDDPKDTSAKATTEGVDDASNTDLRRTKRTLAALAIGLAKKYPTFRNGKKPNISQLAQIATEHLRGAKDDRTPLGFSEKTARDAISDALKACPELTKFLENSD